MRDIARLQLWLMAPLALLLTTTAVTSSGDGPLTETSYDNTLEYEVSNVKVIHRIRDQSEIVAVRLYLLGGARQLTEETAGIEILMLRAAQLEWGETMAATGSRSSIEATADWTVAGFRGLRRDLDSSWSSLARLLERPAYSESSFRRARGELLTAARRRFSEPDLRVREVTQMGAFSGHPYALNPNGTEESLSWLTQSDLREYWERHLVASRMLLVVVGAVAPSKIKELVTATIGGFPAGDYKWQMPPPLPQRESSWLIVHRELPTNYILGLFGGPPANHDDYLPFRAGVAFLSSRLDMMVRDERSLSYAAYAPYFDWSRSIGGVYASTSSPSETFEIIRRELENMTEIRFPRPRWRRYLEQFTLDELLRQMTSDGQAEALARAHLYFSDLEMADEFVQRLRDVNLSSVRRVARKYMSNIQYGYLGDTTQMRDAW